MSSVDVRERLRTAKAHLDPQRLYPRPVSLRRVRIVSAPWFFRLPVLRRFRGYTMWNLILLAMPLAEASEALVAHELCHVWQMQHYPVRMPFSFLVNGYRQNRYELEARSAASSNPGQASTGSRG